MKAPIPITPSLFFHIVGRVGEARVLTACREDVCAHERPLLRRCVGGLVCSHGGEERARMTSPSSSTILIPAPDPRAVHVGEAVNRVS